MDYNELLLAAKVLDMADVYRKEERRAHHAFITADFDESSWPTEMSKWDKAHPARPYIEEAIDELITVADLIRKHASPGQ